MRLSIICSNLKKSAVERLENKIRFGRLVERAILSDGDVLLFMSDTVTQRKHVRDAIDRNGWPFFNKKRRIR